MGRYKQLLVGVQNLETGAIVKPGNSPGWAAYLDWLAAGGPVEPADVVPPPEPDPAEVAAESERTMLAALARGLADIPAVQQLRGRSPAEIDAWINGAVVDLASAKTVLRVLAYVVALLVAERLRRS